jgi:hypothetical protein
MYIPVAQRQAATAGYIPYVPVAKRKTTSSMNFSIGEGMAGAPTNDEILALGMGPLNPANLDRQKIAKFNVQKFAAKAANEPQPITIKLPFVDKGIQIGIANGGFDSFIKDNVAGLLNTPEKLATSLYYAATQAGTVPKRKQTVNYTPTYQEDLQNYIASGYSPLAALSLVGFTSILDTAFLGGLVESGAKSVLRNVAPKVESVEAARTLMGLPKDWTQAERQAAYLKTAQEVHPDKLGGDTLAFQRLNEANVILKSSQPITTAERLAYKGSKTLLSEPGVYVTPQAPYVATKGLLPERAGTVPTEPFQPIRQPAVGLSIRDIKAKPISPALEPLALEARKYKSAEEFVNDKIINAAKESDAAIMARHNLTPTSTKADFNKAISTEQNRLTEKYGTVMVEQKNLNLSKDVNDLSGLAEIRDSVASGKYIPLTRSQLTDFYNQVTRQGLENGGLRGKTGLKKVGLAPEPSPRINTTESQLLKSRIKSEARGAKIGYAAGRTEARIATIAKFNEKNLTADEARKSVENYTREALAPEDRGKFLVTVRDAKTTTDMAKAFIRIDNYAQAQELKQAIRELRKTTEKLAGDSNVSADYRNKIKDIISQYELSGHTEGMLEKLKATQAYLDGTTAAGEDVVMPQRVLDKLKILTRIPKDQLTLSQVQGLQNEIELMGQLGKTKWASKQALYDAEKEARTQQLLNTATPINSQEVGKQPIGSDPKQWVERYIALRNYLQKSNIGLTPIDGLADITGMQPMKAALDLDYGNYLTHNDEAIKQWYELTKDFTDGNFERIGTVAAARQSGGLERLANSGLTGAEIDAIALTPAEENAYQFVRSKFEAEYPAVKKYALDVYNADVGQVDNYVSFMSDYDTMSDLEIYERFGQRAEEISGIRTKTVEQGFTKSRANLSRIKLETNIDKIFRRHLDDTAYMLTMGRDIKQYFEIVNSPEMKAKLGDVGSLAWLQWLDLMARKGGTEGAKRIAALDIIRKNIGAGVLAFRLSSALVQFSSFADTIATIGVEAATRGATRIATSKEWRNFVMDNFPEVKKAVGDDVAFREFGEGYLGKLSQIGLKPLQALDGLMRSTAIAGAYEKLALERGITIDLMYPDKSLVQEATRLMRQSQGSSFFKDQPLAITSGYGLTDNKSLNKTILTFQSFMLNRWDNLKRQVWRMGIKEKNYKKAAASLFWIVVVATSMEEGIRRGTRKIINLATSDEQPEKSFVGNAIMNVVQSIPIMGQLASAMSYSSNPVPIINTFEQALSGITSATTGKTSQTKIKGAVRALGAGGSLFGVPGASQASQIISKAIPTTSPKTQSSKLLPSLPQLPKLPKLK